MYFELPVMGTTHASQLWLVVTKWGSCALEWCFLDPILYRLPMLSGPDTNQPDPHKDVSTLLKVNKVSSYTLGLLETYQYSQLIRITEKHHHSVSWREWKKDSCDQGDTSVSSLDIQGQGWVINVHLSLTVGEVYKVNELWTMFIWLKKEILT